MDPLASLTEYLEGSHDVGGGPLRIDLLDLLAMLAATKPAGQACSVKVFGADGFSGWPHNGLSFNTDEYSCLRWKVLAGLRGGQFG